MSKKTKQSKREMFTRDVNINSCEGCKRHRGHVLGSDPQREIGRGLVVQRLGHQNGRRAIFPVGREVETNRHVGFGHHAVLQVVGHPRVAQLRGGLDSLTRGVKESFADK